MPDTDSIWTIRIRVDESGMSEQSERIRWRRTTRKLDKMSGYGIHRSGSVALMPHLVDEVAETLAGQPSLLIRLGQACDDIVCAVVAALQLAPSRVCEW